jgi:hypothetical protein
MKRVGRHVPVTHGGESRDGINGKIHYQLKMGLTKKYFGARIKLVLVPKYF